MNLLMSFLSTQLVDTALIINVFRWRLLYCTLEPSQASCAWQTYGTLPQPQCAHTRHHNFNYECVFTAPFTVNTVYTVIKPVCLCFSSTGSLPKWVVNRVSQFVAPKVMGLSWFENVSWNWKSRGEACIEDTYKMGWRKKGIGLCVDACIVHCVWSCV